MPADSGQLRDASASTRWASLKPTFVVSTWDVRTRGAVQTSLLRCLQTLRSWCWSISGTQWPKSLEWLVSTGKWKSVHMWAPSKPRRQKSLDRWLCAACFKSTGPCAQAFSMLLSSNFSLRNCGTSIRLSWFSTSLSKPQILDLPKCWLQSLSPYGAHEFLSYGSSPPN